MQGLAVRHITVGKLAPGLANGEGSVVNFPESVQSRLHPGRHASRVGRCERYARVRVEDQLVREAARVSTDVVEDGSADVRLGPVGVPVPLQEGDGYRLLGVVEL